MSNHAVHTKEKATSVTTPIVAESGIPYVVGTAPIHKADKPAKLGVPVLVTSWDEAVEKFGYSDNWDKYTLCEFIYSHFKLYACQPVILCNVLSPEKHKTQVSERSYSLVDRKSKLPENVIIDDALVVEMHTLEGVTNTWTDLEKNTDYCVFYEGGNLIIELISDKTKNAIDLRVNYNEADETTVTNADIADGFESVELCLTTTGIVPDLLNCPKYSSNPEIAAVMAAKASSINGLFSAKALCDIENKSRAITLDELKESGKIVFEDENSVTIDGMTYTGMSSFEIKITGYVTFSIQSEGDIICKIDGVTQSARKPVRYSGIVRESIELAATSSGSTITKFELFEFTNTYEKAISAKKNINLIGKEQIAFWPMGKLGDKKFHLSTQAAGAMAKIDAENSGIPYESPSNRDVKIDSLCDISGEEIILTHAQANILNDNGIVTALNFIGGFKLWGNCTACYPANTDVKDNHIPVSRMFSWVGASLIRTFWAKLDRPMTRRLIDSILDSANIWLNGLVSRGYLLGARVEMINAENPISDLMKGIVRLHVYMTPPSATQEIEFTLEYDSSYIEAAFGA